jgi:glycogen debranching enzyme
MAAWRRSVPILDTDHEGLRAVVTRSAEDLGALRIFDPDYPERTVVAAGAPWFMTLFGRDSLMTAWMALLVDPELALGTLQTLARFQGREVRPYNEEEPGRILHEMRFGEASSLSLGGGMIYYGTADATPLFVMLLGELRRWGLVREAVDELLPAADRAIEWIETFGDRDGDGYVEYQWRLPGPSVLRCRAGRHGPLDRAASPGRGPEGGVQSGLLVGGQGLARHGPGP